MSSRVRTLDKTPQLAQLKREGDMFGEFLLSGFVLAPFLGYLFNTLGSRVITTRFDWP